MTNWPLYLCMQRPVVLCLFCHMLYLTLFPSACFDLFSPCFRARAGLGNWGASTAPPAPPPPARPWRWRCRPWLSLQGWTASPFLFPSRQTCSGGEIPTMDISSYFSCIRSCWFHYFLGFFTLMRIRDLVSGVFWPLGSYSRIRNKFIPDPEYFWELSNNFWIQIS